MRKQVFSIIALSLLSVSSLFANDTMGMDVRKWYCNADQIIVSENAIHVTLEGKVMEVDALNVDQGGIYVAESSMRCYDCRRPINPRHICETPLCMSK